MARALSVLFSLATLWLLYRYAINLGIRWPCVPVLIYAVSAAGLRYAYNARPYAMATFLIVLTLYLAQRKSYWTGIGAAACVATHYFAALCVAPILMTECLLNWKSDRKWSLLSGLSFVVLCAPLVSLVKSHVGARPNQYPGFGLLRKEVYALLGGSLRGALPSTDLGREWKYVMLLTAFLALVGAVWGIRRKLFTVPLVYGAFLCGFLLLALVTHKSIEKMPTDYYLGIAAPLCALLLWFSVNAVPLVSPVLAIILIGGTLISTPMMELSDYRRMLAEIRSDCDHCAVLVGFGNGGAVPACVLYEAKGLDLYLLNVSDSPTEVVERIARDRAIYLIPSGEAGTFSVEQNLLQTIRTTPKDGYFKLDRAYPNTN